MTTTLLNCEIILSKEIGDFWSSTTTSNGNSIFTSLVDTELKAKKSDWITDDSYNMITSGDYNEQERKILNLISDDGTLAVIAHGGQIVSGVTYRVHRLFSASEKRRALIHAAKFGFPHIFAEIRDTSKTVGNWLRNGDMENWALTTIPDNWAKTGTPTVSENTTAPYFTRGLSSCKIITALGTVYQSNTEVSDLIELAGYSVTFSANVWSNVASDTKLTIYDGTTTTSSSYHSGGSTFERLSVTATIKASPSSVSFAISKAGNATIVYVDDCRVIGPTRDKIYIGDLGLALDYPHEIRQSSDSSINEEPWELLRDYEIGSDGYLYIPTASSDYRLRIKGIGYLDFLVSGVSSTTWSSTIDIDSPQTEILVAEAAIYLCNQKIVPNDTSGTSTQWQAARAYWQDELRKRQAKFGMNPPPVTIHWGYVGGTRWHSRYGRVNY